MPAPSTQFVLKTGSLVSSAVTADQVILTYKINPGKQFVLEYLEANVQLTTYAATATDFGSVSLEHPAGTKLMTWKCAGPQGTLNTPIYLELPEPLPIDTGDGVGVVRVVVTPTSATSMTWEANLGGYER